MQNFILAAAKLCALATAAFLATWPLWLAVGAQAIFSDTSLAQAAKEGAIAGFAMAATYAAFLWGFRKKPATERSAMAGQATMAAAISALWVALAMAVGEHLALAIGQRPDALLEHVTNAALSVGLLLLLACKTGALVEGLGEAPKSARLASPEAGSKAA